MNVKVVHSRLKQYICINEKKTELTANKYKSGKLRTGISQFSLYCLAHSLTLSTF